ncbi:MAG: tetratricopeptide repeat protein [Sphingobacteriaceae bacterium]|nr:tetratricopeptide repeat protein [Sphingobacteriaceae bacterium]
MERTAGSSRNYQQTKFKKVIIVFLLLICSQIFSQKRELDSILNVLKQKIHDTIRVTALHSLCGYYANNKPDTSIQLCKEGLKISDRINYKLGQADAHGWLGFLYRNKGLHSAALEHQFKCIAILEQLGLKNRLATSYSNIGGILFSQGEFDHAMQIFRKSLSTYLATGNHTMAATQIHNIGGCFKNLGKDDSTLTYFNRALIIREKYGSPADRANSYSGLSVIFSDKSNFDSAQFYLEKVLAIDKSINAIYPLAMAEVKMAMLLHKKSQDPVYSTQKAQLLKKALVYVNLGYQKGKELGFPEVISSAAKTRFRLHKEMGNFNEALKDYELHIKLHDSIQNESTRKASLRAQMKHEYEKQAAADSVAHAKESEVKNAELAKQSAEIKAKKNQQYALFGGLGLVMIFAGFMYNRFKITQKQKGIIESQKLEVESQKYLVEEKQKEILDSIHYARRIQMAQIPSEKRVSSIIKRMRI